MANKRFNGEGSAGWVTQNGLKYWRITITTGSDPLTGNQTRKNILKLMLCLNKIGLNIALI